MMSQSFRNVRERNIMFVRKLQTNIDVASEQELFSEFLFHHMWLRNSSTRDSSVGRAEDCSGQTFSYP